MTAAISQVFAYGDRAVRVLGTAEAPLFVARDAAACLGIADVRTTLRDFPEDERQTMPVTDSLGRKQETFCLTEPGLYRLIFSSRKEEAEGFRRWVLHDVLPSIRKTGRYLDTEGKLYGGDLGPVQLVERVAGAIDKATAAWTALGGVDAKDQFLLRDWLSLTVDKARRAAGGGAPDRRALTSAEPKVVAEVLIERGLEGRADAKAIGIRAAKLWRERHPSKVQPTTIQRIGGRPTKVKAYPPEDVDLVNAAIDWWLGRPPVVTAQQNLNLS